MTTSPNLCLNLSSSSSFKTRTRNKLVLSILYQHTGPVQTNYLPTKRHYSKIFRGSIYKIPFEGNVFLLFWRILYLINPVFRERIENVEDKCKYYPPWHKVYGPFQKTSHLRHPQAFGIFSTRSLWPLRDPTFSLNPRTDPSLWTC